MKLFSLPIIVLALTSLATGCGEEKTKSGDSAGGVGGGRTSPFTPSAQDFAPTQPIVPLSLETPEFSSEFLSKPITKAQKLEFDRRVREEMLKAERFRPSPNKKSDFDLPPLP